MASLIAFDELEMLKLWKGLYLTMWHSDKSLMQVDLVVCQLVCMHVMKATVFIKTQENLAENIASFVHIFQRTEVGK